MIISSLFILSGCGESFDKAYQSFRSPLNTLPSVTIDSVTGWQISPAALTGSASDADNDTIAYRWSEVTSYGVTFSTPENPVTNVIFTGNNNGDVAVNATIRLTVSDGEDESHRDMSLQIFRNDVIFVTATGTGSGYHPESPLPGANNLEIASAIITAKNSNKKIVALASGTYSISTTLNMTEGVSLYGGYSTSDWSRNIKTYESVIRDQNVYSTTGSPNGAIKASTGVTSSTTLNGVVIEIGRGSWASGILCNSSTGLTVRNSLIRSRTDGSDKNTVQQFGIYLQNCGNVFIEKNSITLGDVENIIATSSVWTVGIVLTGTGSAFINGNIINNGKAITISTSTTFAFGINTNNPSNAALTITNNFITSGISVNGASYGINLGAESASTPGTFKIQNNTICALNQTPNITSCIRIVTSASSTEIVQNNILIAMGAPSSYCIMTGSASTTPDSVKNNLFYIDTANINNAFYNNNSTLIKDLITPVPSLTNLTLLDYGNITENIGNYFVDFNGTDGNASTLSDNDWHIKKDINTPMNLMYGGLDLSADILYDFDGIPRTNLNALKATNIGAGGFTIGAYEKD